VKHIINIEILHR